MLITLKEILTLAEERTIAVGAFNCPNLESLQAILCAAEELRLPVILQHAQCHESWMPLHLIGPIMVEQAKKAAVPVCVHLDHGEDLAYLEKALKLGFTSVMYDGSQLPYEQNLTNTQAAVQLAASFGASVEAELGSMGRAENGSGQPTGADDETKIYTDPILARQFAADTGIDALACSFGTTHGLYLTQPKLDFTVVEQVREQTGGLPVVMHGGSGVRTSEFHKAVRAGVRKINYFTYMDKAGGSGALEAVSAAQNRPLFYSDVVRLARDAMQENVKQAMRTFAMLDEV